MTAVAHVFPDGAFLSSTSGGLIYTDSGSTPYKVPINKTVAVGALPYTITDADVIRVTATSGNVTLPLIPESGRKITVTAFAAGTTGITILANGSQVIVLEEENDHVELLHNGAGVWLVV